MFSGKNSNGNAENEVFHDMVTPQHCVMKLAPAHFPCDFSLL